MNTLKNYIIYSLITLSMSANVFGQDSIQGTPIQSPVCVNGIAAVVDDKIITLQELKRHLTPILAQLQDSPLSAEEANERIKLLTHEVLQELIDRTLIINAFYKIPGADIPKSYVENEYDSYLQNAFDGDRAEFLKSLEEQGKTVSILRKELKENLIVSILRNQKRRTQAEISPVRIQEYYQTHMDSFKVPGAWHLRQITLLVDDATTEEAQKQTADGIIKKLDAKANFADLAQEYSQDSFAKAGGDLGWVERKELHADLSAAVDRLQAGHHTDPIQLNQAIFILNLEAIRPESVQTLEQAHDRIETILSAQLSRQVQQKWIEELRSKAYIQYYM